MSAKVIPREDLIVDMIDSARPKGESEALKKIIDFLDELALEKEEGDVVVELQQQSRGTLPGQAITAFEIRAGDDISETAQQIIDEAVKDGREGGSGKIRYCVVAKGRRGRRSFVLTFPDALGDDALDEYPSEKGALALAMSMLKDCHKTILELVNDNSRTAKSIMVEQGMQLRKHIEVSTKNFEMMGDLYTAHHERQVSLLKAERGEKRMDEVAGFLMTAGQTVFNTFLGKKVFEKAPTAIEHLTFATMSLFSPEQANAMMTGQPFTIRTEQALGLFKLFEALHEQHEQRNGPAEPPPAPYHPPAHTQTNGTTHVVTDHANHGQHGTNGAPHPAADAVT
jgi:hypothetical protein